uniref:Ankyrin-1-like n=1 Tax=Elaeis guineensis var. tenera TaxID=51953 RepID=A0A8N4ICR7_ELAGV|nr:ankyrin-1-like [Elaeis guineensis]
MLLELLEGARSGYAAGLPQIAEENKTLLIDVTAAGYTVLHIAAKMGHAELAKAICRLEMEPLLLTRQNSRGDTPVHSAARVGHHEIVTSFVSTRIVDELGVEHRRLPGVRNRAGNTALHEAAQNGHLEVAQVIMSMDPDLAGVSPFNVATVNRAGVSPFNMAAERENYVIDSFHHRQSQSEVHASVGLVPNNFSAERVIETCAVSATVPGGLPPGTKRANGTACGSAQELRLQRDKASTLKSEYSSDVRTLKKDEDSGNMKPSISGTFKLCTAAFTPNQAAINSTNGIEGEDNNLSPAINNLAQ